MSDERVYSIRELKIKAVFMAIVAAILLVALGVLNRVSLGWFTTNKTVTATGAVAVDGRFLDVEILEAYKNGDTSVNLAANQYLVDGLIPAEGITLGDSMTYVLRVTNKTPDEKFNTVNIYIADPTGAPETPHTVTENGTTTYYWLSSQLVVSDLEVVQDGGDASKASFFNDGSRIYNSALFDTQAGTTTSTAPGNLHIARFSSMTENESITITVTITFENSPTVNQDPYKGFGEGDNAGVCQKIFLISY